MINGFESKIVLDSVLNIEKKKRIKNGQELTKIIESLQSDGKSIESGDSSVLSDKESIVRPEYRKDSSTYHVPETFIQRLIKQNRVLAGILAVVIVALLGWMTYHFMNTSKKDKIENDSQPGKGPPGKHQLIQETTGLPASQTEKEKIEDIEKRKKIKKTGDSSKTIPIKKKDEKKTPVQKKKELRQRVRLEIMQRMEERVEAYQNV